MVNQTPHYKIARPEAGVRFVITSLISDQNWTTRRAIFSLLYIFILKSKGGNITLLTKNTPNWPKLFEFCNIATSG